MRCPQCGFLSFESGTGCRNCGHDFTLAPGALGQPDFDLRSDPEPVGPFDDLLLDAASSGEPAVAGSRPDSEFPPADAELRWAHSAPATTRKPSAPLAVRRPTPDVRGVQGRARHSGQLDEDAIDRPAFDFVLLDPGPADPRVQPTRAVPRAPPAPAGARIVAAVVDAVLLGGINAAVMYFTLRIVGLDPSEIGQLPAAPLVVFLLALNGCYVSAFTAAGGQTIGKMAAGIRVVTNAGRSLSFAQAVKRTLGVALTLLTFGAGFLPALWPGERRTLHDRLADTRVVRA